MSGYRANPVFQAMAQVCDEHGLRYAVEIGKKHGKMIVDIAGESAVFTFSISPSDRLAPTKARSLVRRRIRESDEARRGSGIAGRADGQRQAQVFAK